MKKIVFLLILLGSYALSCQAQGGGGRGLQRGDGGILESVHIAYLTKQLNLSPEEAQRFWPIYNQYTTDMRNARLAYNDHKDELAFDEANLIIKKKYSAEIAKALSPGKANDFFRAEKDFRGFVQKEWMERRQEKLKQRRGGPLP